jgi:hypothetical protein
MNGAVDEISQVGGEKAFGEGSDGGVVEAGSVQARDGSLVADERFENLRKGHGQFEAEQLHRREAHVSASSLVRPT